LTDYDVWAEKPVTAKEVLETLGKNVERTKKILVDLIEMIPTARGCTCAKALEEAEF
jgi:5'-methylthioadenosine phosphorylase